MRAGDTGPMRLRAIGRRAEAMRPTTVAVVCLAVLLGIGARVALSPQLDGLDDVGYLSAAASVARGGAVTEGSPLFALRVGMAYPFGYLLRGGWLAPTDFWILTLAAEIVTLLCLFGVAARWFGPRAGLVAAALYAAYPLAIGQTTMFMPTAFQVAAIAAAVFLFGPVGPESRGGLPAAALAGICLGLGYLVKEDVALVVPVMAACAVAIDRRAWRRGAALCTGAAAVFAAEVVSYYILTGNPLFRLTGTEGQAAPVAESLRLASIWQWHAYLRSLWVMPHQVGLYWWAALPAAVAAVRSRDRRVWFILACLLGAGAYLQFGSNSFTQYIPLPKTPRYTAVVTPFLTLLVAWWLAAGSSREGRWSAWALTFVLASSVPCVAYYAATGGERLRNTVVVARVLEQERVATLTTDVYSARALQVLSRRGLETSPLFVNPPTPPQLELAAPLDRLTGTHVLVDRQALKILTSSYELALPADLERPHPGWTTVWTGRAYPEGTASRRLLEWVLAISRWLPEGSVRSRTEFTVRDAIDGDEAVLYYVPPGA